MAMVVDDYPVIAILKSRGSQAETDKIERIKMVTRVNVGRERGPFVLRLKLMRAAGGYEAEYEAEKR